MKIKAGLAMVSVLSALSFSTFAAQSVSSEQARGMQSLGVITVSGINASPSDINEQLNNKATSLGAKAYHVTEAYINGNYHETAIIYK